MPETVCEVGGALFPSWTVSSRPQRTWLHIGFRMSGVALGLCVAFGVHGPYAFIPLGMMLLSLRADLPFSHRDKQEGRVRRSATAR